MHSSTMSSSGATIVDLSRPPDLGGPVWQIAELYPAQGHWSKEAYFALPDNKGVEFHDGCLEFLPMPTRTHQKILQLLFRLLEDFAIANRLGEVFVAGYPVLTLPDALRQPDVLFVAKDRSSAEKFASGCDLAIEVVSPGSDNRTRDERVKRTEYAQAGIPESWIVDPEQQTITVLTLADDSYQEHGDFKPGETATSVLLEGFTVNVVECFVAGETLDDEGEEDAS